MHVTHTGAVESARNPLPQLSESLVTASGVLRNSPSRWFCCSASSLAPELLLLMH